MPLCTFCTHPLPYLYTVYESAYNLRLEQCTNCQKFADPYVEHDSLTLLIDLILLKIGVYRHLLYNRASKPRKAVSGGAEDEKRKAKNYKQLVKVGERQRENARWRLILRLGAAQIFIDAFIRWTQLNPNEFRDASPWDKEGSGIFVRILIGCLVETVAFHCGVMLACYIILRSLDWIRSWKRRPPVGVSSIRREFRITLVPLTILYSSVTKFFLLFLLSIWRPEVVNPLQNQRNILDPNVKFLHVIWVLDRGWVVRNVLGGMATGFGLRVILDCHPFFTTLVILAGWAVKTAVANLVSHWVSGDEEAGEIWLAYSIP